MVKPSTATLNVNDLDAIVKTIENAIGLDAQASEQADNTLTNTLNKDFNGYVLALGKLLKDNPKDQIKSYCASKLKDILALNFIEDKGWTDIRPETQKFIKETLIQLLLQVGTSAEIKEEVQQLTGDLAGVISSTAEANKKKRMSQETIEWNELKQAIQELLSSDSEELVKIGLRILGDIVEAEPDFFKKESEQLVDPVKTVMIKYSSNDEVKEMGFETFVILVRAFPKKLGKKPETIKEIGEIIFGYMMSSVGELNDEWTNPPESMDDNGTLIDEINSKMNMYLSGFDELMMNLPRKVVLGVFSKLVWEMMNHEDWKHKHCALMCLSQFIEYIENMDEFEPITNSLVSNLNHENPKVRYAALHCIGQAAEDHRPEFQERYAETFLPLMIKLYKDSVPRVAYHSLNATINLLEECPKDTVSKFLSQILEPAISFIQTGKYAFKQASVSTIALIADACGSDFLPYWEKAYEVILKELNNSGENLAAFQGIAIEALTLLGVSVGRTEFSKVCGPLINKMLEITPTQLKIGEEEVLSRYIISAWARVFKALKEDFGSYISTVAPSMFELAQKLIAESRQPTDEDIRVAFVTIADFFEFGFSQEHVKYLEPALHLYLATIKDTFDPEWKKSAAKNLNEMIEFIDSSSYNDKHQVLMAIYSAVTGALNYACAFLSDAGTLGMYMLILEKLIPKLGKVITSAALKTVIDSLLAESKKSQQRVTEFEKDNNKDEDDDGDEDCGENELVEAEEALQLGITNVFGALFKVYKEQTLPLVEVINNVILPTAFSSDSSKHTTQIGLYLIDNIIEFLGVEFVPEKLPYYIETLVKYSGDAIIELRNSAIYGLGLFAEFGNEAFAGLSNICSKAIFDALLIDKEEDDDQMQYDHNRDNIIAAVGRLIKFQHQNIDVNKAIDVWLNDLPLKVDLVEAKGQHDSLVEMLLGPDAGLVLGANGENLQKILEIIAKVLESDSASDTFPRKAVDAIEFLKTHAVTKDLIQEAIGNLKLKLQKKLKSAIAANS